MSDIHDLVFHAAEKSPVEFADAFNAIMHQRCADAVDAKRVEVAQSIYGSPEGSNDGQDA